MSLLGAIVLAAGLGLLIAEAHVPAAGVLAGLGALGLVGGVGLVAIGAGGGPALALVASLVTALAAGALVVTALRHGGHARRREVVSGVVGRTCCVRDWRGDRGTVALDGALWRARACGLGQEERPIEQGAPVIVERVTGLTLDVRRAEDWELVA